MKIAYKHLIQYILDKPNIHSLSASLFQLGHEHEIEDEIFNMEFTPNRGDCLSLRGLLIDLGAFYDINFNINFYDKVFNKLSIDFENQAQEVCTQISFLQIDIEEEISSYKGSLKNYFSDLNINKNNFFTDVSNFISYEIGQPTHCYDASKIEKKLSFKVIEEPIEFETLVDKKINLTEKNSVFIMGDEVINLAGVMGGKGTACSKETRSVLIECAYFKPEAIIGKAIKYDLQSDAAHKFERGVDPEYQERALRRFISVVEEHSKIKDIQFISKGYKKHIPSVIKFNPDLINKIIGINITIDEYKAYLAKLNFIVKDNFITVPSNRSDVKTQNDIAEEVARVIGFDNIPMKKIRIPNNKSLIDNKEIENKVRAFLLDHGFYEVINSPFVDIESKKSIRVDNPLDSNRAYLRTNLIESLLGNLLFNERRQKDSIKLFEISDIYFSNTTPNKKRKIGIIASGRVGKNYNDFTKKINRSYLSSIFNSFLPNTDFKFIELAKEKINTKSKYPILTLEMDINEFPEEALDYNEIFKLPSNFNQYAPVSELPSSFRDISYSVTDFIKIKQLEAIIFNYKNSLLKEVFIFDYFKNDLKNEIKIGFRFIFQSADQTLTDIQVDDIIKDIIQLTTKLDSVEIPGMKK